MDCWTVVDGKVYNLTPFVKMHPGGKAILRAQGIDGTEIFRNYFTFYQVVNLILMHFFIDKFHKNLDIDGTIVACFFEGLIETA